MTRAVRAEWTKLRTLRGTGWLAMGVMALTVALGAAAVASVDTSQCPTPAECFEDTTRLSLTGVWLGQALVAVLAMMAITNEYGTGLIQITFAANPRRLQVFAAKAVTVTGVVLGAGVLGVLGSLVAGRLILPGNGFTLANGYRPLSLADEPTLRAAVGTVLYYGLVALLALAVGVLIRDTVVGVTGILSVLYVLPVVAQFVSDPRWSEWAQRAVPTAGLNIQATIAHDQLAIGPWAGLGVLAGYAGGATLLAGIALRLRDA